MMSQLSDMKNDYKLTLEGYKEAKEENNKELMLHLSEELIRIADAMERI